jgi:flavin-dependent dehydrogenase
MRDVVIAGGGLAGAAAGARLAQAGVDVTIIEREAAPVDKICGEFLSAEAQAYFARLGLDVERLGGHAITHLRLVRGGHAVTTRLPFRGLGLSRKVLDEALLQYAGSQGAKILRGYSVNHVSTASGIALDVAGRGVLRPETLLLATGKHDMRGARRDFPGSADLVGFKMYFRLDLAQQAELAGHVELMMLTEGYAGLQMVEDGRANLCFLVERGLLQRAGGTFLAIFAELQRRSPHLAARLAGAVPSLAAPLAIARVPYGFIYQPQPDDAPGLYRLGDQAAVIQSFTGDGMAIALHSAALAASAYLSGETAAMYHRRLAAGIRGQINRAGALYKIAGVPASQAAMFGAARIWPGALALAARLTRVPDRAMLAPRLM